MSIFITAYQRAGTREQVTIRDGSQQPVTLGADDVVTLRVGKQDAAPVFTLSSGTPKSGGSNLTNVNPVQLTLEPGDLGGISPGIYDAELVVADSADQNRRKFIEMGVFVMTATQTG